jgi:hypothetical protein
VALLRQDFASRAKVRGGLPALSSDE